MATVVRMQHPETGLVKKGFVGFSWTTFFFGFFPALFRGDWGFGLILMVLNVVTVGIAGFIAAFLYNKSYTNRLIEKGYQLADNEDVNALARLKLGISTAATAPATA
ncbi:hypothetical protein M2352_000996 [Azospirillum fermentarium]|uniref:hypothetical protein n=1 Tax=Azospirillum fermentarium TaxID=1233114 RepID=UPI002227F5E8|nr:hypothetical protein [Azospirillum fermentarium]MCW2245405.1 hypothetical protein [Azospirillum fermentarium]